MEKEKSILELCTDILGKVSNLEIGCDLAISATELMLREHYVRINVNRHLTPQEIKSFRKETIYKEKEKFSDLVNLFNTLYMGIGFGGIEKDFAKTILKFIEENGPNHRYDVVTVEPTRSKNEVKYLN